MNKKWSKNDDLLQKYGIIATSQTKSIKLGEGNLKELDVYKIPLDKIRYNVSNGRIYMEIIKLKAESNVDINELEVSNVEQFNTEIENLIWTDDEESNIETYDDIKILGQLEAGVVLNNGVVADGNRRFTCLRKLSRDFPDDERFKYFKAAILFVDEDNITSKDIKRFELNIQFGQNEKVDYKPINFNMSIFNEIENNGWTIQDIVKETNKKPNEIAKIVRTCKLINEYLEYVKKPNDLYIADKLNVYWPLEPLGNYIDGKGSDLSDIEKLDRKHIFFDYMTCLNIKTPTQQLRDNLINKVFSKTEDFNKLNDFHKNNIRPAIKDEIYNSSANSDEFITKANAFKSTETADKALKEYKKICEKIELDASIDAPIEIADDIKTKLGQMNIKPFLDSESTIAIEKLNKVRELLLPSLDKINEILLKIKNKLNLDE